MNGSSCRVLVVGSTPNYIDALTTRFTDRLVFLNDAMERKALPEVELGCAEEVVTDLCDFTAASIALREHVTTHQIRLTGITCFDCESLLLTATLASSFGLPFPTTEAVLASRNKWWSKAIWQRAGIPCPRGALIERADQAARAFERLAGPCILKPLTGSGSELVFSVDSKDACVNAFAEMLEGLASHRDDRMYVKHLGGGREMDPCRSVLIEERIDGSEYSCDFVRSGARFDVLRLAKKIPARAGPPGQTLAYVVPGELPADLTLDSLRSVLFDATVALGIDHAVCMADFIVLDGRPVLLELAPRPGGDCLPPLLMQAGKLDILQCAIDVAEGREPPLATPDEWRTLVGLRVFAEQAGIVVRIDDAALRCDDRVLQIELSLPIGRAIDLTNVTSRTAYVGYAIFAPLGGDVEDQCRELRNKVCVTTETLGGERNAGADVAKGTCLSTHLMFP